jgi:hypothetical protein
MPPWKAASRNAQTMDSPAECSMPAAPKSPTHPCLPMFDYVGKRHLVPGRLTGQKATLVGCQKHRKSLTKEGDWKIVGLFLLETPTTREFDGVVWDVEILQQFFNISEKKFHMGASYELKSSILIPGEKDAGEKGYLRVLGTFVGPPANETDTRKYNHMEQGAYYWINQETPLGDRVQRYRDYNSRALNTRKGTGMGYYQNPPQHGDWETMQVISITHMPVHAPQMPPKPAPVIFLPQLEGQIIGAVTDGWKNYELFILPDREQVHTYQGHRFNLRIVSIIMSKHFSKKYKLGDKCILQNLIATPFSSSCLTVTVHLTKQSDFWAKRWEGHPTSQWVHDDDNCGQFNEFNHNYQRNEAPKGTRFFLEDTSERIDELSRCNLKTVNTMIR